MLDGIKGYLRDKLDRAETPVLSVVPSAKSVGISFDAMGANLLARNGYSRMAASLLGGTPAWSGETVSRDTAMTLSTVYACNKIISESVGFLPLQMMQRRGVKTELATSHPMYSALLNSPNPEITAQNFTELLTSHCVLGGNAFSRIVRRSGTGTAVELQTLDPDSIAIDRDAAKRLVYVLKERNQPDQSFTVQRGVPQDILHLRGLGWDGMRGYSVVSVMARQSVGSALAGERSVAQFYANGSRVPYLLKHPSHFATPQDFDAFRADWEQVYSQAHKVPILEDGLEYQQIGISAKDAQLLESRQFTIPELCRWFSVSPHLVGDLSKATFSNIESLAAQFLSFTLTTWLTRWEQECYRCILTPDEQSGGYYFRHDLDQLLRTEFQVRMAGYAQMLQNGIESIDEIRAREGKNPIPGGDQHYVQVNLAPIGSEPAVRATTPAPSLAVGK